MPANVTRRIYTPTTEQKEQLWVFLLSNDSSVHDNALPVLGDSNNPVRIDGVYAVSMFHFCRGRTMGMEVFSDEWEVYYRERAPMVPLNYPEIEDTLYYGGLESLTQPHFTSQINLAHNSSILASCKAASQNRCSSLAW